MQAEIVMREEEQSEGPSTSLSHTTHLGERSERYVYQIPGRAF